MSDKDKLIQIIQQQDWLMEILRQVRDLNLPDWYVAAGAIRNTVWNYLHGYPTQLNHNDVDVVYFDSNDMQGNKESLYETQLKKINPTLDWEVVNQARAHLFKQSINRIRPPAKSSCEAISYWSEIPTCTGIRLEQDNSLTICSPYGLSDLMNLIVRPIPEPQRDLILYKKRLTEKRWSEIWPKLDIIML